MNLFKSYFTLGTILICLSAEAQSNYEDSMRTYFEDYVVHHKVLPDSLKNGFRFFPADPAFRVIATLEEQKDSPWFSVETSGSIKKTFRVYAIASFQLEGRSFRLQVLQPQALGAGFEKYLFLPFTDASNGTETYTNGRYLDLDMSDIQNNQLEIDFNKAYNPYCAYVSGKYNCPIPPSANRLEIEIRAGEKIFGD